MKLLLTNLWSLALLVPVAEEGTDKDSISERVVVGPIALFHGEQVSFPKEATFA